MGQGQVHQIKHLVCEEMEWSVNRKYFKNTPNRKVSDDLDLIEQVKLPTKKFVWNRTILVVDTVTSNNDLSVTSAFSRMICRRAPCHCGLRCRFRSTAMRNSSCLLRTTRDIKYNT
ncbi:hypothetical protein Btru_014265 [Bulinus truncatus]|nr:hypothetical protein Btru_014265 [Bulinus truncatus]